MWTVAANLVDLNRDEDAVPIIDECLRRAAGKTVDPQLIPQIIGLRLRIFQKNYDANGCRTSAERWEKLNRTDARSLYTAASLRAATAAVLLRDAKTPAVDMARVTQVGAHRATDA